MRRLGQWWSRWPGVTKGGGTGDRLAGKKVGAPRRGDRLGEEWRRCRLRRATGKRRGDGDWREESVSGGGCEEERLGRKTRGREDLGAVEKRAASWPGLEFGWKRSSEPSMVEGGRTKKRKKREGGKGLGRSSCAGGGKAEEEASGALWCGLGQRGSGEPCDAKTEEEQREEAAQR